MAGASRCCSILIGLLSATQLHCTEKASGPGADAGAQPAAPVTARLGPAGGTVSLPDGALVLFVPPGALAADTDLSIAFVASPPPGAEGPVFDLQPSGLTFQAPVRLTFRVSNRDLSTLRVARYEPEGWRPLGASAVSPRDGVVFGETTHLSLYSWLSIRCAQHSDCPSPERCLNDGICGIPCAAGSLSDCPGYTNCLDGRCVIEGCAFYPSEESGCGQPHVLCIIPPFGGGGICGGTRCALDSDNQASAECSLPGSHALACRSPPGSISGICELLDCDPETPCPAGYSCVFGDCVADDAGCECGAPGCPCSAVPPVGGADGGTSTSGGDTSPSDEGTSPPDEDASPLDEDASPLDPEGGLEEDVGTDDVGLVGDASAPSADAGGGGEFIDCTRGPCPAPYICALVGTRTYRCAYVQPDSQCGESVSAEANDQWGTSRNNIICVCTQGACSGADGTGYRPLLDSHMNVTCASVGCGGAPSTDGG